MRRLPMPTLGLKKRTKAIAWALTLVLHASCLLKTCNAEISPSDLLQAASSRPKSNTLLIALSSAKSTRASRSSLPKTSTMQASTPNASHTTTRQETPNEHAEDMHLATSLDNAVTPSSSDFAQKKIDQRALYGTHTSQHAGALLELEGWMWDSEPCPQDNTEEVGKLVFGIKVDSSGEVVAIQTLEKTVNSSVEKLYRDALADLTFSRTEESYVTASPTLSQGKVTFILRVR